MKKTIITICGLPGSGKSSTAMRLAQTLAYKHFSSGDLFRAIAKARSLSIEEINKTAELEKEIDYAVDERLRQMASENEMVIDSRMAFHWMPRSFKVFLKIDPRTAAERTFKHMQEVGRTSQSAASVDEVYAKTVQRTASELKRYAALYDVDYTDESNFDLVVDTALHPLDEVVKLISEKYREWLNA
jgi:cytidylate kinase